MRYLKKYKIFESKDDIVDTLNGIYEYITDDDDYWKIRVEKISESRYRVLIFPIVTWNYDTGVSFKRIDIIERSIEYMNDFDSQTYLCSDGDGMHSDTYINPIELKEVPNYTLFARGTGPEDVDYIEISFRKKNNNKNRSIERIQIRLQNDDRSNMAIEIEEVADGV